MSMVILKKPDASMLEEIRAYRQEFEAAGSSMDGTGALRKMSDPADWLESCRKNEFRETTPPGLVPATQYVLFREEDRKILGMIQIRHELNENLAKFGGHIGYSVRPSERRKGYAAFMLQEALPRARALGLSRVLITCLKENEGSRRTILKNGGLYESDAWEPQEGTLERYWISL